MLNFVTQIANYPAVAFNHESITEGALNVGNGAAAEAKDPADDRKIAVTDYAEYEEVKALDEKHAEPNNLEDSEEDQNKTVGRRDDRNKEPYRIAEGPEDSCRV